jgi:hypothetical protein
LPRVPELLVCAKDLFVAARTVRHELQGIMRRAQPAAIRRVQQTSRSIQAGATATDTSRFSGCGMTSASVAAIKRHLK